MIRTIKSITLRRNKFIVALKIKLTILSVIVFMFQLKANSSYSQNTKISVTFENETLSSVLRDIESKSKFKFLYNRNDVDLKRLISLKAEDERMSKLLHDIFTELNIEYEVVNRQIVLRKKRLSIPLRSITTIIDQQSVSGTVLDSNGLPLGGANILEKGTTNGVQSDFDGNFTMTVPGDAVLVVSYIGFSTAEVAVNSKATLNITLEESAAGLDEVVVIGYGTVRKSDLTGSVSSIGSESIEERPITNVSDVFQGNSSGVAVNSGSGAPGSNAQIRIRGISSINGSVDPLIVVDGIPFADDSNSFNSINPQDIASIEILKDASSTAIYGSRGSNGVILITTKRGSEGRMEVNYSSTAGVQNVIGRYDMLNSSQYAALRNDIASNDGLEIPFDLNTISSRPDTDWQDVFFKNAIIQTHQLSASGGNDKVRFYTSANYVDQEGVILNNSFQRGSLTATVDVELTDNLSIGNSITVSRQRTEGFDSDGSISTNAGLRNSLGLALSSSPLIRPFDEEGNIDLNSIDEVAGQVDNPILATENIQDNFVNQTIGNFFIEYDISNAIKARTTFGYTLRDTDIGTFISPLNVGSNGGTAIRQSISANNYVSTNQLTFNKDFGKSNWNAVAVVEAQRTKSTQFTASTQTFVLDNLTFNNLESGANILIPSSTASESSLISYLARINYTFDNKYFLTASGRYDGSSRLAVGNQYNFFPSVAVKWKVSNEEFLASSDFINELSFGASYGQTGSQGIDPFGTLSILAPDQAIIGDGDAINIGFSPANFANRALTWETATQLDVGVDLSIYNGKYNMEVSYFDKVTEGLFFDRELPAVVGTNDLSTVTNIGSIKNQGIEIDIDANIVTGEKFSWKVNANLTYLKNRIENLAENDTIFTGRAGTVGFGTGSQLLIEGDQLGHFFGLQNDGLYDDDTSLTYQNSPRLPGDRKYVDQNGDGNINNDDRVFLGYGVPNTFWGLTSTWRFKGLSLSVFFQASHGNKIANYTRYDLETLSRGVNYTSNLIDRYTPTNTNTDVPRASIANQPFVFGDDLLEDGGFVRVKTLTLGYRFPNDALDKIGLRSLNIFATGTNLFTFTDYSGIDPDVTTSSNALNQGYDDSGFPSSRSIVLGLNIGL